jgi:hypothetical protein
MYVGMQVADHYVEAISYVSGMAELDARSNKTRLSRIKPHQINVSCTFRVVGRPDFKSTDKLRKCRLAKSQPGLPDGFLSDKKSKFG